ncbi:MAG: hypothetical protein OXC91_14905 [Rhodobacteraceae bacterium]|nr:hypothetical protein [Paracoccaceae bacterium]
MNERFAASRHCRETICSGAALTVGGDVMIADGPLGHPMAPSSTSARIPGARGGAYGDLQQYSGRDMTEDPENSIDMIGSGIFGHSATGQVEINADSLRHSGRLNEDDQLLPIEQPPGVPGRRAVCGASAQRAV